MTTNYPDRLDDALVRPGRIDNWVKFTTASKDQVRMMYNRFIDSNAESFDEFYKHIKGLKLSTAALQQFFFTYRDQPVIDHVDKLKDLVDKSHLNTHMYC